MTRQVLAALLLYAPALQAQQHAHQPSTDRLGTVHFPTSCAPAVAPGFDHAVALLHSFEFRDAIRGFEEVLAADSTCAMAWWGIALSRWSNPMAPMVRSPAQLENGRIAAANAMRLAAPASARERGYAAAIGELFAESHATNQRARVEAYERAMEQLSAANPDDPEARIFYAIAMVGAALPSDKTYAKQLKAGAMLEEMFARQPDHPGLAHYIIHGYDVPALAPRAADAARRYADIAPAAAHALHMPSHTFTRVGMWQQSVETNLRSRDVALRSGSIAEALHASDYAVYAYLQMRNDSAARAILLGLPALAARFDPKAVTGAAPGSAGVFALAAMPARYALERRAWSEAAALTPATTDVPYADAITHFARALGAAHLGDTTTVRASVDALGALRDRLVAMRENYWAEQVEIQRLGTSAWLEFAAGRREAGIAAMRQAASREDATEKAAVTPGPIAPARELLADMLLAAGRRLEALAEYRAALTREPKRGWSERSVAMLQPTASSLQWRMIGPFRGGRTKAGTGVPSQPNVFYFGADNGGVWKSDDYGRVWTPIFDDQPTGSIGAVAVSVSNPNVVYVGTGEGLQRPDLSTGDGVYRSDDAGKTWRHLGLRDGQQIPQIIIDPTNPDRIFVAVLGHPYGPNEERGIFRSTDGGRTFEKVLYKDENTGGAEVQFDPSDPRTVYAVLWAARQGPWENGAWSGQGSGLFKSIDGGTTWRRIGEGLPTNAEGLGRIGFAMSPSMPARMYAVISVPQPKMGIYRSDDAGEHWTRVNSDSRLAGREGDFQEAKVDPKNADVVYVANVMAWKSTDGGRTFAEFKGAPGGDDYQRFWINPNNPDVILLMADQGAVVSVNGGRTWSSWYNQPTGQFYHVNTDFSFPYMVCGGQQESGAACVRSRSDDGQITFEDWMLPAVDEYGYVTPDPLHPNIYFGGRITRTDMTTRDAQNVSPVPVRDTAVGRVIRTMPSVFSTVNPRALYYATNVVWKTLDGGRSWAQISPDLTRKDSIVPPPNVGVYSDQPSARARHRGVVYALAPSYVNERWIWAGSDDGLIHVTRNGGTTWRDVTPPEIRARPWSKISIIDAGRFDSLTAYVAVNTFRLDDLRPHIWATHDGGNSWREIVNGIPDGGIVNVVREDPVRRGLLFAGTERFVYYSVDDGATWRSLRLNMPAISIRDLVVKDNDVVVATHGRSFWILDDVAPLRQMAFDGAPKTALYRPSAAWRFRFNRWPDTPLPPDEPTAPNPPDGAIIDYSLEATASTPVLLEILDSAGALVRRYSSDDSVAAPLSGTNVPSWWVRPPQRLGVTAGAHRFAWDLHYPYAAGIDLDYPINAAPFNTVAEPRGPVVLPGRYTVRLSVNGRAYSQPLVVRMDPRVKTTAVDLRLQFTLSKQLHDAMNRDPKRARELQPLYEMLQSSDAAPTPQLVRAVRSRLADRR